MWERRVELLVLALPAAAAIWDGGRIAVLHPSSASSGSAGTYVAGLGLLLVGLALARWIQLRSPCVGPRYDWGTVEELRWVATAMAILVGYVFLISYVGYVLSTAIFLTLWLRLLGSYRWVPALVGSLAAAIGAAYLWAAIDLGLPQGVLPWP